MATKGHNFRLDDASREILRRHAERLGISQTDVLKIALRDYDKAQTPVTPPPEAHAMGRKKA
jgi:hypothetical protein